MSQVFISYSHKDKDFVQYLTYKFSQHDVSLWIDVNRLYASEIWRESIELALTESQTLILVITPDSMNSPYVKVEWEYFLKHNKPIVPIILRKSDLPNELEPIQRIEDFAQLRGFDVGFTKLIYALQRIGINVDPRFEFIGYKTDPFDPNAKRFFIRTPELLISRIRSLNHAIRIAFPHKLVENVPLTLTHKGHLMDLLYGANNHISHSGFLDNVSNELNLIDQLLTSLLPHYGDKFLKIYRDLLSCDWMKMAYIDDNMDKPFVIETLRPDEVLLTELYDSAKEFANEFNKRSVTFRFPPPFAEMLKKEVIYSGLLINDIAVNSFLLPNQKPDDWIKVHCGHVRVDWKQSPTEEEKHTAQKVITGFLLEKFWYLTSFR